MAQEIAQRGRTALVFRSEDGLDELSNTAVAKIWQVSQGVVTEHELDPASLGLPRVSQEQLLGGDAKHNAEVATKLFQGVKFDNSEAIRDVVLLNAAAGIVAYNLAKDQSLADMSITARFTEALTHAQHALDSGEANKKLIAWSQATHSM
jgi:anthranilate phosphoribosyltransferase